MIDVKTEIANRQPECHHQSKRILNRTNLTMKKTTCQLFTVDKLSGATAHCPQSMEACLLNEKPGCFDKMEHLDVLFVAL